MPIPEIIPEPVDETPKPEIVRYTEAQLEEQLAAGTFEKPEADPSPKPDSKKPAAVEETPEDRIKRLEKANEDARVWNARRDTELGNFKKEAAEAKKVAAEALELLRQSRGETDADPNTKFFTDPKGAVKETVESLKKEEREAEEKRKEMLESNQAQLKEWDPDYSEENVRRAMKADVQDETAVEQFIKDQLYGAPILAHLQNQRGKLIARVEALEKENQELKKNGSQAIKKIAQAARQPRGSVGGAVTPDSAPPAAEERTLEQIKADLKKYRTRG